VVMRKSPRIRWITLAPAPGWPSISVKAERWARAAEDVEREHDAEKDSDGDPEPERPSTKPRPTPTPLGR